MLLQHLALRRAASSRICANCLRQYSSAPSSVKRGQNDPPKVIFSGIQPTGVPHLGNYLGALREWVKLQNTTGKDTTRLFCVVDLHAITIKQDREQLTRWRKEMLASLMAVGLNNKDSILFCQSSVPQHAELMWLLSCSASMGYLSRMTQWKSKMSLPDSANPFDSTPDPKSREAVKLGLFSYPVLQAADILLYGTTHVPVGEDQAQHLEFAREVANSFNHTFSSLDEAPILIAPQTILSSAKRVMSLKEPTKKMSKSDADPRSRILITDARDDIYKKIKGAKTDSVEGISYDRVQRPGVSNLIDILCYMDESISLSPEEVARDMENVSMRSLKEKTAESVEKNIGPIRERYNEIMSREGTLANIADEGAEKARSLALPRLREVKRAMGILGFSEEQ